MLVVDGPNVLMRAVKATERVAIQAHGIHTAALLVFINSLSKHVREENPDRLVVCWEGEGTGWREAVDPLYKAQRHRPVSEYRDSSFSLVRRFCALANVPQDARPGFEADDLVAAYWRISREPVVILSNDKDFLQLLDPPTVQVRLSSGGAPTDRWDADRITEVYGCRPEHIPLAMAMAGDPGDGVEGIPGVGMKTALKHLAKSGWDLNAIDHPKIVDNRDLIQANLRLVDLRQGPMDLGVPSVPLWRPTVPGAGMWWDLVDFLREMEMFSVLRRLNDGALWHNEKDVSTTLS